ncbi:unnamed protein product [Sphenostylis stenocarpa]|uniref:Dolichyl-diphosphooligosaccharide--protein glycosyltransferase subunit KCP2 n=1 Tax=Sphenostylis stenocarpa TaxID=92480 RepID=A0AA86T950_9FABA|nr:unnamed protein product [Sphenostylis stenocarpa]
MVYMGLDSQIALSLRSLELGFLVTSAACKRNLASSLCLLCAVGIAFIRIIDDSSLTRWLLCFLLPKRVCDMAGSGSSMLYSFLLFTVILSLQEMYRGKLASSELFTILGGFISSLLFLVLLTFIGNLQETIGAKTGWGAVIVAETVALIAASTVHRVCITTCFLFSAGLLYEVNKISGYALSTSDPRTKKQSGRA